MRIGLLADRTGSTVATIRYYEEIGLLRPAARQGGGQRTYDREDVRRLTFIRRCREYDFSIRDIRALVSLMQDSGTSCTEARSLAATQLAQVRRKLIELRALETSIGAMITTCDTECAGGPAPDCVIFADHGASR